MDPSTSIILSSMEKIRDGLFASSSQMLVTALVLIFFTGLLGGIIAKKAKQPLILGYILAGVLVGFAFKAGFGVEANEAIDSLANIGVALLLFSMGLEFSRKDIAPVFGVAVWGSLAQVAITLVTCTFLAFFLTKNGIISGETGTWLLFGTAFVSTSTAVLHKTFVSKNLTSTLSHKVMISLSIVQDLTVIPIMLLVCSLFGGTASTVGDMLKPIVSSVVFMAVMMTLGVKVAPIILRGVAKFDSKELFLLTVTAIALGSAFVSEIVQASFSFGAFLAGIALSESEYGKKALYEMMPVRDIFVMLFFVSIGMMLDWNFLSEHALLITILVVVTGIARTLPLSAAAWIFGYRNVIPVAMFFGMFPTSEIAFVVIQAGKDCKLFDEFTYSAILCTVVVSMIAGPLVDKLTSPVYAFLRRTLWKKNAVTDSISIPLPELRDHVIIAGGGHTSRSMAKLLSEMKLPNVIIEPDFHSFKKAREAGLACIYGEANQDVILESAGIKNARIFLAASQAFSENLAVVKKVKHVAPELTVITRSDTKEELEMFHGCDVFEIVQPKFEAGLEMTRQALLRLKVPAVTVQNFVDGVRRSHYKPLESDEKALLFMAQARHFLNVIELNWTKLAKTSPIVEQSIKESHVRTITGVSIVGIIRGGSFISNPGPDEILHENDVLAVIGTADQRERFERMTGTLLADTPSSAQSTSEA